MWVNNAAQYFRVRGLGAALLAVDAECRVGAVWVKCHDQPGDEHPPLGVIGYVHQLTQGQNAAVVGWFRQSSHAPGAAEFDGHTFAGKHVIVL